MGAKTADKSQASTGAKPKRSRRKRHESLGVDWFLPGRRVRFATTTVASAWLIDLLATDGHTWAQVADAILYDDEAKAVAAAFVEAGYADVRAATMVWGEPVRGRAL